MNKNKRGFTLIELLVVVLIIGILSSVALPQYRRSVDKARYAEIHATGRQLARMLEVYFDENGEYPHRWRDLSVEIPNCSEPNTNDADLTCGRFFCDLGNEEGGLSLNFYCKFGSRANQEPGLPLVRYFYAHTGSADAGRFTCQAYSAGDSTEADKKRAKAVCKSLCIQAGDNSNWCYI